ncbi:MAG: hypothetical protein U5J62_02800 [Desulfurivibrio sp.]|nr:hypothetical protein [Desulfurivibrio sp.]
MRRLLAVKLRGLRREFEIEDIRIAGLFKGMSHADVERVLRRAAKDMILSGKEFLSENATCKRPSAAKMPGGQEQRGRQGIISHG